MATYSNHSNDDEFEAAVGANQLNSVEDDITDVLNGDFDDIMNLTEDDMDTLMDARDDLADLEGVPDDAEFARHIVEECVGVDEQGEARAAVSMLLEMVSGDDMSSHRVISQQAIYKPIIEINKRMEFIEVLFHYPTAIDTNLRVMMSNLDKYAMLLNENMELSVEVPFFTTVLFPLTSLGTFYMTLHNPVMWALTADKAGEPCTTIKVVYRCEDIGFYQTDDIDMADVQAAIDREEEAKMNAMDILEEKEAQKAAYDAKMEELRRTLHE